MVNQDNELKAYGWHIVGRPVTVGLLAVSDIFEKIGEQSSHTSDANCCPYMPASIFALTLAYTLA